MRIYEIDCGTKTKTVNADGYEFQDKETTIIFFANGKEVARFEDGEWDGFTEVA